MVIAAGKLIVNGGFNTNIGFMPIYRVGGNTKVIVKSKIVKTLAGAGISDIKKVLTGVLPN